MPHASLVFSIIAVGLLNLLATKVAQARGCRMWDQGIVSRANLRDRGDSIMDKDELEREYILLQTII